MFLVPTRSPRLIDHFRSSSDEFQRSDFRKSEKEMKRERKKKFLPLHSPLSAPSSLSAPSFEFFFLSFIFFKCDSRVIFSFTS